MSRLALAIKRCIAGDNVSTGGMSAGLKGISAMSNGTGWFHVLGAKCTLTVVVLPSSSTTCFTEGFWRYLGRR